MTREARRDDFDAQEKRAAADTLSEMLQMGWRPHPVAERLPLTEIARAHELVESGRTRGRILLDLT